MINFIQKVIYTLLVEERIVFLLSTTLFFLFFLNNKSKFYFRLFYIIFAFIIIFNNYSPLPEFFNSLGQDSLFEINSDFNEAFFYLKTLFYYFFDTEIFLRNRFWLLLISSFFSGLLLYLSIIFFLKKNYINKITSVSNVFSFGVILIFLINIYIVFTENYFSGKELDNLKKKIEANNLSETNNLISKSNLENNLLIITYIGESTTAFHWNLYGYPFNTTPKLNLKKKDKNFILFDKVFSRYTHTTPSLIDSLSLCKKRLEECSDHEVLNYFPITQVLKKSDVETYLFSTQGSLGGHNFANQIVLNTDHLFFSYNKNEELAGNRAKPKIKDLEFFNNTFCKNEEIFNLNKSKLVFLHSYAGHGGLEGYTSYLPENKKFIYPNYINKKNFLGKDFHNFNLVSEYDAAMHYVDQSIDSVINCSFKIAELKKIPIIFIYFSDHGESPSTSRGHDSSRRTYDMHHIPFFIYFNNSAYEIYKKEFDFLFSLKKEILTSNFISDLILYLFKIETKSKVNSMMNRNYDSFFSLNQNYLGDRKKLNGEIESIKIYRKQDEETKNLFIDLDENQFINQDISITLWQLNNFLKINKLSDKKSIKNLVCQHRADSFILQYKNSLSTGCFETNIHFEKEKALSKHDLEMTTNLNFEDFLKSNYQKNTVWLDAKNLNNSQSCNYALIWLRKNSYKFESILLELPTNILSFNIDSLELQNCIKELKRISNIEIAYYLPTDTLSKCSSSINKENNKNSDFCNESLLKTKEFLIKYDIKSITFDYSVGEKAVSSDSFFSNLKWHIWHVGLNEFKKLIQRNNIGIILLKNDKNLNNLN